MENKFEYKVIAMTPLYSIAATEDDVWNYDISRLNTLGNEGWEICGVDGNKYLLKRKIY